MSIRYNNASGQETILSGLTPGGDIEAGAVMTRSGQTESITTNASSVSSTLVTFDSPMPDTDYEVVFTIVAQTGDGKIGNTDTYAYNKTINGFNIITFNGNTSSAISITLKWKAIKTYTVQHAAQNAEDIAALKQATPAGAGPSNKFATANDITRVENSVEDISEVIDSTASITNKLVSKSTMDTVLSGKQDTLEFDDTPTAGSENPVTSDGIYDALETKAAQTEVNDISDEIADMNNILGAKNLLPNNVTSQTINGVTFTVNSDGSITANGTATSQVQFTLAKTNLEANKYKLSGVPNGSKDDTYFMLFYSPSNNVWHDPCYDTDADKLIMTTYSDDMLNLIIRSGQTVSNIMFKPMIRPASIKDDTYVPYSMTNREMTPYVQAISNPNLLDNPWFTVNQRGYTTSSTTGYPADRWQFVYNPDGCTITRNGNLLEVDNTQSGAKKAYLFQLFEDTSLAGQTFTGSVLLSDGTILSGTAKMPTKDVSPTENTVFNDTTRKIKLYLQNSTGGSRGYPAFAFEFDANCSVTIKAVKLELGSVSTLAMDTAPNYATELLKCQRYYERLYVFQHNILSASASYDRDYYVMPKRTQGSLKVYSAIGTANKISLYINGQWEDADYADIVWNTSILNTNIRLSVIVPANSYFKGHIEVSADL